MTELTTGQIVKIIIAVLVLVVMIGGIIMGFRGYVIPYFKDIGPSEQIDLTTPYYQELLQDENLVGVVKRDLKYSYIIIRIVGSDKKDDWKPTTYYFFKDSGEIYKNVEGSNWNPFSWTKDPFAGKIAGDGKIVIEREYIQELEVINGAERIGDGIRKK